MSFFHVFFVYVLNFVDCVDSLVEMLYLLVFIVVSDGVHPLIGNISWFLFLNHPSVYELLLELRRLLFRSPNLLSPTRGSRSRHTRKPGSLIQTTNINETRPSGNVCTPCRPRTHKKKKRKNNRQATANTKPTNTRTSIAHTHTKRQTQ